ncbi:VOC family protein [Streptomyces pinistramenti]|uniref:VOC family protein n=1 Tax=Streptomyces pinistramenti TaxID=2884812 RepID=UPI001D0698D5|nr:VOC family protein [Streptomyces pinistramenti]MCB5911694.1 VOC family protein [Streptomyces pinistramenti]
MTAFADGAPCWVDVLLPDLDAGKRFYGALFGWTFDEGAAEFGGYTQAFRDGRKAAGLMPRSNEEMPTGWGIFFATADIGRTATAIREAGGRIRHEAMRVGDLGSMLIAADPAGAVFGAWQAGTHTGFEISGRPGGYVWMGLNTRDPQAADAFYAKVFGFVGVEGSPMARPDFLPWRLRGQEREIGCRIAMDASLPADLPSHFTVCFLVGDMGTAVRTATGLGGEVVARPQDTPGGPFAVFRDNQGATFGVMAPK